LSELGLFQTIRTVSPEKELEPSRKMVVPAEIVVEEPKFPLSTRLAGLDTAVG
jgi:hypothetical protein